MLKHMVELQNSLRMLRHLMLSTFLKMLKYLKKSIWYIIVEKQENELQMVKYNNKKV
jgi:hypothetical protein